MSFVSFSFSIVNFASLIKLKLIIIIIISLRLCGDAYIVRPFPAMKKQVFPGV
jgi:hypothetical protein